MRRRDRPAGRRKMLSEQQHVLVVEDDVNTADIVRAYLEKEGYGVIIAHDGPEGLSAARYYSPDLIILDLLLPGANGLDVCQTLRNELSIPIIMRSTRRFPTKSCRHLFGVTVFTPLRNSGTSSNRIPSLIGPFDLTHYSISNVTLTISSSSNLYDSLSPFPAFADFFVVFLFNFTIGIAEYIANPNLA